MFKTCKTVIAALGLALGLGAGSAQALPFINGTIGFSDGGLTLSGLQAAITNSLTNLTLGLAPTTTCTGAANFDAGGNVCASASIPATVLNIPVVSGAMNGSFTFVGLGGDIYTFTLTNIFGTVNRVANHNVGGGLIQDHLDFIGVGTVSDSMGLFEVTAAALGFSADGSCTTTGPAGTVCTAGTATASWNGVLNALGRETIVPEPATLGLLGVALVGLGFARRRKQA